MAISWKPSIGGGDEQDSKRKQKEGTSPQPAEGGGLGRTKVTSGVLGLQGSVAWWDLRAGPVQVPLSVWEIGGRG